MKNIAKIILAAAGCVALTTRAFAASLFIWIAGGDSITGCANTWFFQYLVTPSVSDCGSPDQQEASSYYASSNIIAKNLAISGTTLATGANNLTALAPIRIDPVAAVKTLLPPTNLGAVSPRRVYVFSDSIGSNDGALGIYGSVALYAAANAAQCVLRKTNGFDICIMSTLLPRGDGCPGSCKLTETNRLAYNALLQSASWRAANGVDYIFDFASQVTMGNPANLPLNNGGDTTYFNSDNIHPSTLGQSLLVPLVTSAWNTIISTH